jgi:thymidylate synthase
MNSLDNQYIALLNDILANGVRKEDRTGTGTISVFGRQIRHKMSEGFPLLTTKKMPFKTIVTELLWFLNGDTNIKFLVDNNCHIWDGDAYKNYLKWAGNNPLTIEEFIEKIKTDSDFAGVYGELGPIYGKQWRKWANGGEVFDDVHYYDQIQKLINDLKTNPDSRRLMVNAWNVGELDQMVLPPCHYGFQMYTRELSLDERRNLVTLEKYESVYNGGDSRNTLSHSEIDQLGYPARAISLMWNQRSVDTFLGLPFNIASYGLLLEIIAREVNMVPDELIGNLGDVHLYSNHIEQAKEQIGRDLTFDERTKLLKEAMGLEAYKKEVSELVPFGGGMSEYYDSYKIPYSTREPYTLPNLVFLDEYHYINDVELVGKISFNEKINRFRPDFFKIENYQSHPAIKAPLSN